MIPALSTPQNRKRSLLLLAGSAVLALGAVAVGVNDNLPGLLLGFLAAVALVLAVVHPWRTEEQYRYLLWGSLAGSIVLAFLHNGFEALAHSAAGSGVVHGTLTAVAVASFLIAVLVGPPAFVVGLCGAVVMSIRNRRHPTPPPAATA